MFLSQTASQVRAVSPVPAGTIVLPVWLLTLFFALMIMLFFLALGRRHPSRHRLFNWLSLLFFVAALVAAGQTNLITNGVKALEALLTGALTAISTMFATTDASELTTSSLAFIALLFCIWFYHRSLNEEGVGLQIGMGVAISLLMIFLSHSSQPARQFTSWLLNFVVGGIMAGGLSLIGGGAVSVTASDSRASVLVPAWFALTVFSIMVMFLFFALSRKSQGKSQFYRWWALFFATVAILSASKSPVVVYLVAAFQNFLAATVNGLSKANVQATTTWVAVILVAIFLLVYSASRSGYVAGRGKAPERMRLGAGIAIPLLLIVLVQSSTLASQVASVLVTMGTYGMNIVLGFAEVI